MASPNISEIMTTTIESRTGKLRDNITENSALLTRLASKGNIVPVSGGNVIYEELEYAENVTFMYYDGGETLNISPSDTMSASSWDPKQAAVAVYITGKEETINQGKEAIINLLEKRIKNAEKTIKNNLGGDMYSDGTGTGGKQIAGLQHIVADAPTSGTVGGISRSSYSFWQNIFLDCSTEGAACSAANVQRYMNKLYFQLVRNNEAPDFIVADNNYYNFYLESLQAIQRISDSKLANAGFQTLKYMNSDVVLGGGKGSQCPSNHMYFLNTDYIYWRPYNGRNMVPLKPDRFALNQDATVRLIGFMGNMTCSNSNMQGVMIA